MIIWITGRKNSGKTTLALKLSEQLTAYLIDGDQIRERTFNTDFSKQGIEKNLYRITAEAKEIAASGDNVVIACISPFKEMRKKYQAQLPGCIEIQMPFGEMWPGSEYEE